MLIKKAVLIAAATLCLSGTAWATAEPLAADDSSNLLRDPALLSRNDINLSGNRFLQGWLSKTNERERIKANMYLLGVMDATEGNLWCSYQEALPTSLRESLFDYFSSLSSERKKRTGFVFNR